VDECTEQASMLHADHLHLSRVDRASRGSLPGRNAGILAVAEGGPGPHMHIAPFKMRIPICAARLHPTYEVTADALARW
jgi:hypothetical protein